MGFRSLFYYIYNRNNYHIYKEISAVQKVARLGKDECITNLTWCPAERYVILYDHADIFAQAEPIQYQIALDILNSAKEYWEANNITLKFLTINK
ncbi:barstar family protein [Nostoc sp.]|uniref:barstar family protein n=1 Tax=Nostoc sp. TaxID=1180 RepID=UPI002FF662FB